MPIDNEIKRGSEIGKVAQVHYIWTPCARCNKERWVRIINGKPANELCKSCAQFGIKKRMKKQKLLCSRCSGKVTNPLALFELREDGTKVWRTDLCGKCDKAIAKQNGLLKSSNPNMKWREV